MTPKQQRQLEILQSTVGFAWSEMGDLRGAAFQCAGHGFRSYVPAGDEADAVLVDWATGLIWGLYSTSKIVVDDLEDLEEG